MEASRITQQLKVVPILFITLCLSIVAGCYYDNEEDLYKNLAQEPCDTNNVTYSGFIQPLVEQSCAIPNCHGQPLASISLTTYQSVETIAKNDKFEIRIKELNGVPLMPQGGPPLPNCDIEKIMAWINAGALQN